MAPFDHCAIDIARRVELLRRVANADHRAAQTWPQPVRPLVPEMTLL